MTRLIAGNIAHDRELFSDFLAEVCAQQEINFGIPGPFSRQERILCYYLAREIYTGGGSLVELGSFLGASTQAFAAGLKHNQKMPESAKIIETFDTFQMTLNWAGGYQVQVLSEADRENFLPRFEANLKGYEAYYRAHKGDITSVTSIDGNNNGHIEMLFCDLSKTEDIMVHVAEHFISKIPTGGYYIQQDYLFGGLPFIKSFHEYFWEYFEIYQIVQPSIVFRVRKPFNAQPEVLQRYKELSIQVKQDLITENKKRFDRIYAGLFDTPFRSHA